MANNWARRNVPLWVDLVEAIEETLDGLRELSEEAQQDRAWSVLTARAGELLEVRRRMKEDVGRVAQWRALWEGILSAA